MRKINCRDQHPKTCNFWKNGHCYRGSFCVYLHKHTKFDKNDTAEKEIDDEMKMQCDRCTTMIRNRYFCEFCKLDFCAVCTNSEAHNKDYDNDNVLVDCNNIHKHVEKSDMEVDSKTVETRNKKCQCSKEANLELRECKGYRYYFFKHCSAHPLMEEAICLRCMFSDFFMVSSKPKKKSEYVETRNQI